MTRTGHKCANAKAKAKVKAMTTATQQHKCAGDPRGPPVRQHRSKNKGNGNKSTIVAGAGHPCANTQVKQKRKGNAKRNATQQLLVPPTGHQCASTKAKTNVNGMTRAAQRHKCTGDPRGPTVRQHKRKNKGKSKDTSN